MGSVGILIVGHLTLAKDLITTTRFLIGDLFGIKVRGLSINPKERGNKLCKMVTDAIKEVDEGEGVLILTDLLGGTPTNICIPYIEKGKVELITGVNLPMVISSITNLKGKTLSELSESVRNSGKDSICIINK
ncbi:MAG: PTS sugar transporter [Deltaproteobacteria bacterium]|nr:PTS sugar transporter [Deltaproteobacteria bacterium]MBW2184334.1 PTS sugar transporter [Deltaproteobacteria bacterium]